MPSETTINGCKNWCTPMRPHVAANRKYREWWEIPRKASKLLSYKSRTVCFYKIMYVKCVSWKRESVKLLVLKTYSKPVTTCERMDIISHKTPYPNAKSKVQSNVRSYCYNSPKIGNTKAVRRRLKVLWNVKGLSRSLEYVKILHYFDWYFQQIVAGKSRRCVQCVFSFIPRRY